MTLTPALGLLAPTPARRFIPAALSPAEGWSCDDFPCEDDIAGFLQRIQVPPGYELAHYGKLPGQPQQITFGPDGRLYATVLLNGSRNGAVYALNPDGSSEAYSQMFVSPVGLAFQPGTNVLYVTSRLSELEGGALWRIPAPGVPAELVLGDLPCCFSLIDNQPNGITFGPDGYLYLAIGALTDHAEPPNPEVAPYAELHPLEAAILRIHPHTGEVEVYARGLRNPFDLDFDTRGRFYATDSGLITGPGDRLLHIIPGGHYGWPYYGARGCESCPTSPPQLDIQPDFVAFPDFSLPRGLVVYKGTQFPSDMFDNLFVVLWNGTDYAQRVVRIDPQDPRLAYEEYTPEPFVTGLIRPIDAAVAPDGSLIVADFIYGNLWQVRYTGLYPTPTAELEITQEAQP